MLIEHALLAFCIGAFIGKFLALEVRDLPLILLEGCQEGREPRDILKRFFQFPECQNCHYPMKGLANIPIIGYLLLRGKCPNCLHPLYFQTFLLELGIALLFGITTFLFSLTLAVVFVLLTSCLLISCFITDYEHGILPDQFTLSLLWVGLIASLFPIFISSEEAILGAVVGYGILWLNNEIYRYFRHQDGIFPGDFKLNAAIGACVGVKYFLITLAFSMLFLVIGSLIQFLYAHRTLHVGYLRKEIAYGCYASIVTVIVLYFLLSSAL